MISIRGIERDANNPLITQTDLKSQLLTDDNIRRGGWGRVESNLSFFAFRFRHISTVPRKRFGSADCDTLSIPVYTNSWSEPCSSKTLYHKVKRIFYNLCHQIQLTKCMKWILDELGSPYKGVFIIHYRYSGYSTGPPPPCIWK